MDNLKTEIRSLFKEIIGANKYFQIFRFLKTCEQVGSSLTSSHQKFWDLTIQSYQDSTIQKMAKLYSRDKNSLSILNFLENLNLLDTEKFYLKEKEAGWSSYYEKIVGEFRSNKNPMVNRLLEWNQFSSEAKSCTLQMKGIGTNDLSLEDLEQIIKDSFVSWCKSKGGVYL